MSNLDTGGPAFPQDATPAWSDLKPTHPGMTLRQYAAIKLRVPDSGTEWLDEMIIQSLRDEFAAKAMSGMWASDSKDWCIGLGGKPTRAASAYEMADAMISAREA